MTKHVDGCERLGAFNVEGHIVAMDKAPTLAVRNTRSYPKVVASDTPLGVITALRRGNNVVCSKNRR